MTDQVTHLHIATTTGLVHWALIAHASSGMVGLISGFLALAVTKGSRLHKAAGMVFVVAMISLGLLAAGIYIVEGQSPLGGLFAAYMVFTAMTTVRPIAKAPRWLGIALGVFAIAFGVVSISGGIRVMNSPSGAQDGVPFGMFLFLGTIGLLAGGGDLRMIYAGGVQGAQRIARHLWRMCFGLFFASGSFFLGQRKFLPKALQVPQLLIVPAVLPLVMLLYWLWRVRRNLRGLVTAASVPAR